MVQVVERVGGERRRQGCRSDSKGQQRVPAVWQRRSARGRRWEWTESHHRRRSAACGKRSTCCHANERTTDTTRHCSTGTAQPTSPQRSAALTSVLASLAEPLTLRRAEGCRDEGRGSIGGTEAGCMPSPPSLMARACLARRAARPRVRHRPRGSHRARVHEPSAAKATPTLRARPQRHGSLPKRSRLAAR